MSNLKIKQEGLAKRCEICHQTDSFDAINSICQRCDGVRLPAQLSELKKMNSYRYIDHGAIIGAIVGLIIGLIEEIAECYPLIHSPSLSVIVGMAMVGVILGAITGSGIARLH